jgi:hypothetical protein
MIVVYRKAIQTLMEVNPLADHIDLKVLIFRKGLVVIFKCGILGT